MQRHMEQGGHDGSGATRLIWRVDAFIASSDGKPVVKVPRTEDTFTIRADWAVLRGGAGATGYFGHSPTKRAVPYTVTVSRRFAPLRHGAYCQILGNTNQRGPASREGTGEAASSNRGEHGAVA